MVNTKGSRRMIISLLLIAAGFIGAAMRWYYPKPLLAHDMGTLLMVMWIPAVGNFIGYAINRWPPGPRPPPALDPAQPFAPDVQVELDFPSPRSAKVLTDRVLLMVGTQVFSGRCRVAGDDARNWSCELQFFVRASALPHFTAGTSFLVVEGATAVGKGRVVSVFD